MFKVIVCGKKSNITSRATRNRKAIGPASFCDTPVADKYALDDWKKFLYREDKEGVMEAMIDKVDVVLDLSQDQNVSISYALTVKNKKEFNRLKLSSQNVFSKLYILRTIGD